MLSEIHIEALLIDEELAGLVWEAWDAGLNLDDLAAWFWCQIWQSRVDYSLCVGD